ncbi:MAG: hypothetical protein HY033_09015 [Ignavibacteriae bacterium]|nr:hypothetical protein [Ignavibacteria bacterium]MBI3365031.1 hypothetical protein [Ignavibacteriota bacterium]
MEQKEDSENLKFWEWVRKRVYPRPLLAGIALILSLLFAAWQLRPHDISLNLHLIHQWELQLQLSDTLIYTKHTVHAQDTVYTPKDTICMMWWQKYKKAYNQQERQDIQDSYYQKIAGVHLIQIAVCFLLIALTPRPTESKSATSFRNKPITLKACLRVRWSVRVVFSIWILYYLGACIADLQYESSDNLRYALSTMFDIWSGTALIWLYLELSCITVNPYTTSIEYQSHFDGEWHRMLSIIIAICVTAAAWIIAYASSDTLPLWNNESARQILTFLTSSLAGIAFALVVSCLSRLMLDPGPAFLGIMYFYAMIQLTAVMFGTQKWVYVAATTVALPLKVIFWLIFVWQFETGRMWNYLRDYRSFLLKNSITS